MAPNWRRIQATLGLSLRKLEKATSDSMVVRPYFGKPVGFGTSLDVFVLMSFKPELRPVYEDHILNVTNSLSWWPNGRTISLEHVTSCRMCGKRLTRPE